MNEQVFGEIRERLDRVLEACGVDAELESGMYDETLNELTSMVGAILNERIDKPIREINEWTRRLISALDKSDDSASDEDGTRRHPRGERVGVPSVNEESVGKASPANSVPSSDDASDAVKTLVSVAKYVASSGTGNCDVPNEVAEGEWTRCGGCWNCVLSQLGEAADKASDA